MKKTAGLILLIITLVTGISVVVAQPAPGCSDEKSKQFDFWIGEWDVTASGKVAGTNGIRPILDGCVLQENWVGAGGSAGSSFNFYNPSTGKWHQYWVWRNGTVLDSSGGYSDGKMILEGSSTNKDGQKIENRITWYDNKDETVRQHWEQSKDEGKTWKDSFDGLYRKKD